MSCQVPIIVSRFAHKSSAIFCERRTFDWCKIAGAPVQKRTFLWLHNLPRTAAFLGEDENDKKWICSKVYRGKNHLPP